MIIKILLLKDEVKGARVFVKYVHDPERFGVATIDWGNSHKILEIEEKPLKPDSHYCVTGLYVYDNTSI